jgi:glycosyltransferase involved in cell wall biosynthesis
MEYPSLVLAEVGPTGAARSRLADPLIGRSAGNGAMTDGSRLRVLYLIDKMGTGGAQTHLEALVAGLDPHRFEVELVCLLRGGIHADRLREREIPVTVLGLSRLYMPSGLLAFLRFIARLRSARTDVLHTYLSAANVFGCAAARAAAVTGVISSRRDTGFGDGRLMRRALALTNRWAHRVVAVSDDIARIVGEREGLAPPRLVVIPNGIDTDRFTPGERRVAVRTALGIPPAARLVVSVSRLAFIKGIDVLVEAVPAIRAAVPDAMFLVAGDGSDQEKITRRIEALDLRGSLRLLGVHEDVPGLLAAADLFVLPSRSEGQPNAVIEAMAMGLPVVASRVGGVPEVSRHDREALLVEPERPALLAQACVDVLTTPELSKRLGHAGRHRARAEFSLATMLRRYQDMYLQVAGRPE